MASRKSKAAAKAKPEWERTPQEVDAIEKVCAERAAVPRFKISKSESGMSFTTEHIDNVAGQRSSCRRLGQRMGLSLQAW